MPGKTGKLGDSVSLDNASLMRLAPHLDALKKERAEHEPLWRFTYAQLRGAFDQAVLAEEVGTLRPTLYGLGHGGASHDRITNLRSLMEVGKRGRWRSSLSIRRYEKHGRLALQVSKLPENVLRRELCWARWRAKAGGGRCALLLGHAPRLAAALHQKGVGSSSMCRGLMRRTVASSAGGAWEANSSALSHVATTTRGSEARVLRAQPPQPTARSSGTFSLSPQSGRCLSSQFR